jgi:ABC-type multidrug transport system fused ATPase/permease subunit
LREKDFVKALSEKLMDMKKAFFKKIMITARMELAFRAIRVFIVPVVIFLGSLAIFYDKINLGELFVIASYLNAMQRPVFQISRLITKIPKGLASLGRLEELDGELNQVESFVSTQNPPILSKSIGRPLIKVEGVEHSWSEREEAFINVGRLKLESGDFVGVVGASGTGKSSFLKFLNRLIDPNKGEIFIQNILSKNIEKESLRKKIRIVLQDNFLLSSSVRENISLSGFDGDDAAVWEALSLACAKSFVESLPNGLDTRIGRGGHPLSGGQIKRINLARALYDLSEVSLIGLDEPTTGLDPENAAQLIVNLKKLSLQGKTVVWVTHNLSEVTEFDRVFSLENRFLKDIGPSV